MPKYTLHYFPVNGRAVIARAILSAMKADWLNNTIKFEDWPKIKKSGLCEYEQVPILEVDGKAYSQSYAIDLYLAKTFKLMGKDAEENYIITNILMSCEDYWKPIGDMMYCKDESKKPELKEIAKEKFKFFLGKFEKKYVELGKGKYFLGDKFTLADITLATGIPAAGDLLGCEDCPCKEIAPNLKELLIRLKENELKEFFEKYYVK